MPDFERTVSSHAKRAAPFRVPDLPGPGTKFPSDIGENSQLFLPAVCFL